MALPITEAWIREKVQLKHNNLEDVKSLSLPGTYHDKIGSIGNALKNFSRLKSLDLSRNAVETLEGLENLKCLEKLNLYYNNVASLQEMYKLRFNQKLQDLDLRLNPVARNEPDYRLFLIHMLPNLRRLDDRSVRDSERQAALTHFSSDQAAEMTVHQQAPSTEKTVNPRVQHVQSLAKPASLLDAEDVDVLDLIAQTGGDLNQPRQITGSTAKHPESTDFSREEVQEMEIAAVSHIAPALHSSDPNNPHLSYVPPQAAVGSPANNQISADEHGRLTPPSASALLPPAVPVIKPRPPPPSPSTSSSGQSSVTSDHQKTSRDASDSLSTSVGSSSAGQPGVFPASVLKKVIGSANHGNSQLSQSYPPPGHQAMNGFPPSLPQRYPNIPSVVMTMPTPPTPDDKNGTRTIHLYQPPQQSKKKNSRVQFAEDPNLKFQDENDAYMAYKATGHFTPHPSLHGTADHPAPPHPEFVPSQPRPAADEDPQPHPSEASSNRPSANVLHPAYTPYNPYTVDMYSKQDMDAAQQSEVSSDITSLPESIRQEAPLSSYDQQTEERSATYEHAQFLRKLCDMVDKYWNGTKSLHNHQRFMYMANKYVEEYLKQTCGGMSMEISKLKNELVSVEHDNSKLRDKVNSITQVNLEASADEEKMKKSLLFAQREADILRAKLQKTIDENRTIQDKLGTSNWSSGQPSAATTVSSSDPQQETLIKENSQLRRELDTLQVRVKQYSQMQELASMLQESHKSLVQTNDHLLRDLNETRKRHQHEVQQLHWSYDQLKKTVGYLPQAPHAKPTQHNGKA